MEETIARILTELEEINQTQSPLISPSTLLDLQSLLSTNDPYFISQFFDDLPSKTLSPSSLTNLLSLTMDSYPSHYLLASKVYLSLLLSPNSPVFTLFTPISFFSLLRSLRRAFKNRASSQPEESPPPNAPSNKKRKCAGKGRGARGNVRSSGDCNEEISDCSDIKHVFTVFEMLVSVLGLIHLDRFPDSLKSLVQTICEIPMMAMEKIGNSGSFNRLMGLCSLVLSGVLRPEHGEIANTAAEVLKALSPLILMVKSQARSFALVFVTQRMMELGNESDGVKKAVVNFPRYLVQKAPEKAELRALAVDSIMEVVKVMDFEDQIGYVDYVLKMTHGKANLRLLGVDLIAVMLMSLWDPFGVDSEPSQAGFQKTVPDRDFVRDITVFAVVRATRNSRNSVSDDRNSVRDGRTEVMGLAEGGEERPHFRMNDLLRDRCMDEKATMAPDKTLGYHYPRAIRPLQLLPPSPPLPRLVESFQKSHSSCTHVAPNGLPESSLGRSDLHFGVILYFFDYRRRWSAVGLAAVIGARFLPAREYHRSFAKRNDMQDLRGIWESWDSNKKFQFYQTYGDIPYLLYVEVDDDLLRALIQLWNPGYNYFTLNKEDLVPTIEEYTTFLHIEGALENPIYSRSIKTQSFLVKLAKIAGVREEWVVSRTKQKGESEGIAWTNIKELIQSHPYTKVRFNLFALVETFRSLNACRKLGGGRFSGCAQFLYVWIRSHFLRTEKVSYRRFNTDYSPLKEFLEQEWPKEITKDMWINAFRNLQSDDIVWRAPWQIQREFFYKCGDYNWVMLLGLWGGIGYAPLLVIRQYEGRQFVLVTVGLHSSVRNNENIPLPDQNEDISMEDHIKVVPS
ncbi:ubiquitin-like-specific protease ESD4-like [Hibiscus syriacus]|uniref:Ubiquitin-like-specific protease ESD4-like n=1 Tax=Hibiscus syriacus TaxID=106335 RepID=A0A6A3D3J0_HIBSY|nr:ubiquitin-like-specific protease ESD4-like [Hibiscus syriacus]